MENKNNVTITANCFYGYIDDSTPCGRAKAEQVKADMETLATMLQDDNLTDQTKKAIYLDYSRAIREYVEREETCDDCTNEECDYYEEEEWEDEEYEEEFTVEDMGRYSLYFGVSDTEEIDCNSYAETVEKVGLLLQLGIEPIVYGYDNEGGAYRLDIIERGKGIYLELTD